MGPTDSVSVTVPVYNSAPALRALCARIIRSMENTGRPFEVIIVDDGSTDGSAALATEMARRDSRIKVLIHTRNFGQSAAVRSGLRRAKNVTVITVDDDLQHRPEDFPRLLQCLDAANGRTLVIGVRANRRRPWWREWITAMVNMTSNMFLEKPLPLYLTTFCCFRRTLAQPLIGTEPRVHGPWISTLVATAERTIPVPVDIEASLVERSRYGVRALWSLFQLRSRAFVLRRLITSTLALFFVSVALFTASIQLGGSAGIGTAILAGIAFSAAILGAALGCISIAERRRPLSHAVEYFAPETAGTAANESEEDAAYADRAQVRLARPT